MYSTGPMPTLLPNTKIKVRTMIAIWILNMAMIPEIKRHRPMMISPFLMYVVLLKYLKSTIDVHIPTRAASPTSRVPTLALITVASSVLPK